MGADTYLVQSFGIGLLFACASLPAPGAEPLDLQGAINRALQHNPDLRRSSLLLEAGDLRVMDAATAFRPNVLPELSSSRSGGQSATRVGARATQKLPWGTVVSGGIGEVHTSDVPGVRPSKRFEIQQPLFRNFGSEINREPLTQATSAALAERRRHELRRADVVMQVVQIYENIVRLDREVAASRQALARADRLYRLTQVKENLGKTTRVDTLRVELMVGQAQSRLEAALQRLAAAQRDLADHLGYPVETAFQLTPAPQLEADIPDAAAAIKVALDNRLDYALAMQELADARRTARLAGRRTLPDLRLTVSYDDFPTTLTSFGSVPFGQPLWFVGLSVPTEFNLAREQIAISQARVTQASAEQSLEILRLSIARQVHQQIDVHRRALAEMAIAQKNLDLAERRSRLSKTLFDLGRTDNFAVTDAEVAFLQAESATFSARSDVSISAYQLARVLGTITEVPENLKVSGQP